MKKVIRYCQRRSESVKFCPHFLEENIGTLKTLNQENLSCISLSSHLFVLSTQTKDNGWWYRTSVGTRLAARAGSSSIFSNVRLMGSLRMSSFLCLKVCTSESITRSVLKPGLRIRITLTCVLDPDPACHFNADPDPSCHFDGILIRILPYLSLCWGSK
jgi:hypothetical protein